MYRQGLGDCFLITLPRKGVKPYYILVDCGVILGTQDAAAKMIAVVNDIIATTGGHVDLLIATHEHWDHLSGFVQAKDAFAGLTVGEVWLGWTEDPEDDLAKKLRSEHHALRLALASACARLRFGHGSDSLADSMLEFFGAAGQGTTGDALKNVKAFNQGKTRFCFPQDVPVEPEGTAARLYVLGPPHDEKMIKKYNPSKSQPETYGMAMSGLEPTLTNADAGAPFDLIAQIPLDVARQMAFFQEHYWGEDADSEEKNQSWRRIDADWLDVSSSMALQLDSATNNTSLVIAIELEDGDILLFAGDAQVGNWLSWHQLSWNVAGKTITGPDLLSRTILYKTGHHGSHNATLQKDGLELMKRLQVAFIPVDHAMAVKKRWGKMPLEKLEARLNEITNKHVLRIDQDVPAEMAAQVVQDKDKKLYYEVAV
jgi:L-ascorbate metabolism protein UlaG (beta-lactamase superfamily)